MGHRIRAIIVVISLVLAMVPALAPAMVSADDVTVYPTEDSYLREDFDYENYGGDDWLNVADTDGDYCRTLIRIDDQTGGGNVTDVLLKMYYINEYRLDAEGKKIRVYRCVEDFKEMEVCFLEWKDGWEWTSEGGDYTSLHYAETEMPEEDNWVTWNITEMAMDAWVDDGDDLYVIIKYKYENKTVPNDSISWFHSNEKATAYIPKVVVTFAEAVQTPEVDSDIDEYGSTYVDLEIYPTLYDWPWANVTAQVSLHDAGNWTLVSGGQNVTTNDAVVETVTGLSQSTEYDVRAKLIYSAGTVYSTLDTFTTPDYQVPTWDIDVDDIEPHSATLEGSWTGNTDNENVGARIMYKREDFGTWTYTSLQTSNETVEDFAWNVTDLREDWTYDYRGRFAIDGYIYYTDIEQFSTSDGPAVNATVIDQDLTFFQLRSDYQCNEVDEITLQARTRRDGSAQWEYSTLRSGLTGNGTEYFLFEDLLPAELYEWFVDVTYASGSSSVYGTAWTASIDVYPVLSGLDATFVAPNIIQVSVDVVLNDVGTLDPELYVDYRLTWESAWSTSTERTDVNSDGTATVDLICGDELEWDSTYDYYAILTYIVGSNQTAEAIFAVPAEPFAVETVEIIGTGGTMGRMVGRVQMGDLDSAECKFIYWVQGSGQEHSTAWTTETSSGQYIIEVSGLVYGEYYSFKAYARDPDGTLSAVEGGIVNFRAGYWTETVPPVDGDDAYDTYGRLWNWLVNSTAGHWTILLLGMVAVGVLFHRRREIAVIACLFILGIGIVVGWVDTWVIVLLALGAGLTIWRFVTRGQRGSAL